MENEKKELAGPFFTDSDREDLIKKSMVEYGPYLNKFLLILAGGFIGLGILIILTRQKKGKRKNEKD